MSSAPDPTGSARSPGTPSVPVNDPCAAAVLVPRGDHEKLDDWGVSRPRAESCAAASSLSDGRCAGVAGSPVRGVAGHSGHPAHVRAGDRQASPCPQPLRAGLGERPPVRHRTRTDHVTAAGRAAHLRRRAGSSRARARAPHQRRPDGTASPRRARWQSSTATSWMRCTGWGSMSASRSTRQRCRIPIPFPEDRTHATYDAEHAQTVSSRALDDRRGDERASSEVPWQDDPGAVLLGDVRPRADPVLGPARRAAPRCHHDISAPTRS